MHFTPYCSPKCKFSLVSHRSDLARFSIKCKNFESIIKSGTFPKIHCTLNDLVKKHSTNNKTNSSFWKFKKKDFYYFMSLVNIENLICFPEVNIYDDLILEISEKINKDQSKNCYNSSKISESNFNTSHCDILKLFDLLETRLKKLNIISFDNSIKNPNVVSNSICKKFNSRIEKLNWISYLTEEINDFLNFKILREDKVLFNIIYFKWIKKKINQIYCYLNKHRNLEYSIQILRLFFILIILESNEIYDISKFVLIPISFVNLISVFLDIIFQILNWNSSSLMNFILDIIFAMFCLNYFLFLKDKNKLEKMVGLCLFCTLIFRILFIHQCRYYNKYLKFQVTEIVRFQLKKIFLTLDEDMDSKISYSQFEYFCIKLGINNNKKHIYNKLTLEDYLFKSEKFFDNCLYLTFYRQFEYLSEIFNFATKTICNSFSKLDLHGNFLGTDIKNLEIQVNPLQNYFIYSLLISIYLLIFILKFVQIIKKFLNGSDNYFLNEESKFHNIVYSNQKEYFLKIDYIEFEKLLTSVDTERKMFEIISCNTQLFSLIDGNVFFSRKLWYERLFFSCTIFIFISIPGLLLLFSYIEKITGYFNILNYEKLHFLLFFLYTTLIFFSIFSNYKIDRLFCYMLATSKQNIIHKYNRIYGIKDNSFEDEHLLGLKGKETYNINNSLHEFVLAHILNILENNLDSFSKCFPSKMANSLFRNYGKLSLNVQYEETTILFSDIVGFTNIAEKINPYKLFEFLTEYFDQMIVIIENYKGTLLEIVGDAILVIWNSPTTKENHSVAAINASLEMKNLLKLKSSSFLNICLSEINIKCGIHKDHVLIGNIGGKKRMKYGILGDGVNLASRIESLSKRYYADIIISNEVFISDSVKEKFIICPLDIVIVQGKTRPTVLYHVINKTLNSDSVSLKKSKLHTKALLFFLNKKFSSSLKCIGKINKLHPEKKDPTMTILSKKCKYFEKKNLGIDWSYVEILESKIF